MGDGWIISGTGKTGARMKGGRMSVDRLHKVWPANSIWEKAGGNSGSPIYNAAS